MRHAPKICIVLRRVRSVCLAYLNVNAGSRGLRISAYSRLLVAKQVASCLLGRGIMPFFQSFRRCRFHRTIRDRSASADGIVY